MKSDIPFFDVIIVGAGLSGIGAAHHLEQRCPQHRYAILEARSSMGGTWDLFRYPGIRSDSDMYTLGYSFKPWIADEAIADGPAILQYIQDTAREGDIERKIHYNQKVKTASWSSTTSEWTLNVYDSTINKTSSYRCNFIFMCSGYYDYDKGYTPDFKGIDSYKGQIVHPQKWPDDLDYTGKKIIVIGSGATAVTLVPELARKANGVTMLQRSPTYILSAPQKDAIANWLRRLLPSKMAYGLARWKNILFTILFFSVCRIWPNFMKRMLMKGVRKEVGPDIDVEKHFSPYYKPWDQRLCLVPESDFFKSLRKGTSRIVTDQIESFTENGIKTKSGDVLDGDIIVTATGLNLLFMGGMELYVDDKKINSADLYSYRGMMYSDVPNLAQAFGYTNASWTLKCDLTCEYVCRLLNYMKKTKNTQCVPRMNDENMEEEPFLNLSSNYIKRSEAILPKQGSKSPWKLHQNYALDIYNFRFSSFKDGVLEFT